ncbi:site-specific recombinase XerD [Dysgonomonas alginatilytica]|uniref:Site-specific recombinase XerD n=1 Tax=Dysgonomonas alginatilytica TaxID=1605892 RepID=A0A2V3PTV7_9BACT|nr:site-specific integrase [Dysgonomonas alginatilytica]PXV67337.1 site-specific recombinase XerD [Dysgonomonas alginatilytica]
MSITIDVICYTSKVLKNNEYPLMLRLTKDRQRKYKSIGVSTKFEDWDFNKNQPKPNTPNRDLILELSAKLIGQYRKLVLEFKAEDKDYTLSTLLERVNKPIKNIPVGDYFLKYISSLKVQKRSGYAASILQVYNSLIKYNKHLNIYFSDIDVAWLRNYESWLREGGLKENTIGIRFRTLRAIYNSALEEGIVKAEYYPFKAYKVSKLHQKTAKRALKKEDIYKIIYYDTANREGYTLLAIELFTYSYVMGGINFVDMAYLTKDNIIGNQLIYSRRKTKKLIKMPIHQVAIELHQKYNESKYIFPILSDYHITEQQRINRVHKVITKVNRELKAIGEELNIPISLTTYVARHSFATVLKRSGVSTSIISESLGHSNEKVTQTYLDSFENSQINEAMKNLL